jgi:hypothetical protein
MTAPAISIPVPRAARIISLNWMPGRNSRFSFHRDPQKTEKGFWAEEA